MQKICQSCEIKIAEVVEPCDSEATPYYICKSCHNRLIARSLRPREWYNLSKRFGWWQFLLHDDFYDEDGTASQPEEQVENAEAFPIISLIDAAKDAQLLLDYTITQWRISEEVAAIWCEIPPSNVLKALNERFINASNDGVRAVILEVASIALKRVAADLVESAWNLYPNQVPLSSLIHASAACLTFEIAFERATAAVEALQQKERRNAMLALGHFQSPATLDWIEKHASEPVTDGWGYLAAASGFSWTRATNWLQRGRPHSLVAIDALLAIANPRTLDLRSIQPVLLEAPSASKLQTELQQYVELDGAPRVRQRVDAILGFAKLLSTAD